MFYIVLSIIQIVLMVGLIGCLGFWYYKANFTGKKAEHIQTKKRLNKVPIYQKSVVDSLKETVRSLDVASTKETIKQATQQITRFLGKPDIEAGDIILGVPCLNPKEEGWDESRVVTSCSNIMTYRPQGSVMMKLYELTNKYTIWDTGKSTFLMKLCNLSPREALDLEKERQAAIDRDDGVVEDFRGYAWDIVGAFGTNTTYKPGQRKCSYMEVTSSSKIRTSLDKGLLDNKAHDYYDMQAVNQASGADANNQIMLAFYVHGDWYCYLGRKLKSAELAAMKIKEGR